MTTLGFDDRNLDTSKRTAPTAGPMAAFARMARDFIREGDLAVTLPGGGTLRLGDGTGQTVKVSIRSVRACLALARRPLLALGEAYMEGDLVMERGSIHDLIELTGQNLRHRPPHRARGVARWWRDRQMQLNNRIASRRNVAHHYDLSADLYRRFLDADMQYSCAYFARSDMTLDEAQAAKKRHIAAKLRIEPGHRVLDIGCGWGGLGLSLARLGAEVEGVTLSSEQLAIARERAASEGLQDRARFSLTDYRDVKGPFDRIVSVGMFEHVGRPNFQAYFDRVAALLKADGVALVHTIGRAEGPGFTQPWIAKYIFPGGYIPALSEIVPAVERAGLVITDIEILRLHYAETLRCWRERFQAQRTEISKLYDERFCRMWEFYLSISEASFRYHGHSIFQLQLARRIDALPITRDYIGQAEARFASAPAFRSKGQ